MKFNFSTYFVLPLIGINYKAVDGYINSFIEKIGFQVYILANEENNELQNLSTYRGSIDTAEGILYIFQLDSKWYKDIELFKKSKYSEISDNAKKLICYNSGLRFNEDFSNTSILLLNLLKHPKAKEYMMKNVDKYSQISQGHTLGLDSGEWIRELEDSQFIDSINSIL